MAAKPARSPSVTRRDRATGVVVRPGRRTCGRCTPGSGRAPLESMCPTSPGWNLASCWTAMPRSATDGRLRHAMNGYLSALPLSPDRRDDHRGTNILLRHPVDRPAPDHSADLSSDFARRAHRM